MNSYQRILCATDFSEHCTSAAERAAELARLFGAELLLLHVVEYFPEQRSNEEIAPENVDPAAYREQQARASLAALARRLGEEEVVQEVRFTTRSARHEIVRFAEQQEIDLIVVATHGRHGITHILGATANGVMHDAPCDVLAVRARG